MSARARALYLIAVAIGVFFLPALWMVGAAAAVHAVAWLVVGLGAGRLLRQLRKLGVFLAVIFVAYSLVATGEPADRWIELDWLWGLRINTYGAALGLTMATGYVARRELPPASVSLQHLTGHCGWAAAMEPSANAAA